MRTAYDTPPAQTEFVVLQGLRSALVLECSARRVPLWRYWGPCAGVLEVPGFNLSDTRPNPPCTLLHDQPLALLPTFGAGWFQQSALLAHRAGTQFSQEFGTCRHEWVVPGRAIRFVCEDKASALRAELLLELDPPLDLLRVQTRLTNIGQDVLELARLASATLPLPAECQGVRSWSGQWANEFLQCDEPMPAGIWQRENHRGRTSHDVMPGALVAGPGAADHSGTVYGTQLAWSGNHYQTIEWLDDGRYQWQLGEWFAPGEVRLAPGEALQAAPLLAVCSDEGYNGVAQRFHAHARSLVRWPGATMRPRPVHLNTWEAVYFAQDAEDLRDLATQAAALGVERFILDDGWFARRTGDHAGLGDWIADTRRYPDGLAPLARHVEACGMEFGLWVEPEMINPDSDLFRAHPDWVLHVPGQALRSARNQLVLDLTRPAVCAHIEAALVALIQNAPISYLKWDHNRDLVFAGSAGRAAYRAQTQAFYALVERVRMRFPHLEVECCASGGARIDFGVLPLVHRFWPSDCNDAVARLRLQRGFLQFFPAELMGAHVGGVPAHTTGRSQALDFRAAVALPGHLGLELDVRRLETAERTRLAAWIALYKELRGLLHRQAVTRGDGGDGVYWQAHGGAPDARILVFVYRVAPTQRRYAPSLRLPCVATAARYRVSRIEPGSGTCQAHGAAFPGAFFSALAAGTLELPGSWLQASGLPLPRMMAETALILQLERLP